MELKPCRCGAMPRYVVFRCRNGWMEIHQVECFNHPSKPIPRVRGLTEKKAIEAWNRRRRGDDGKS